MGKYDGELFMRPFVSKAEQGDLEAQLKLIDLCVTLNQPQARYYWASKAAKSGAPEGIIELAMCYILGSGVPENPKMGLEMISPYVERGNPKAMNVMGAYCEVVENNPQKAMSWYQKAMAYGHHNGTYNYARMVRYGLGCPREPYKALPILDKLAEHGHSAAAMDAYLIYSDTFNEGLRVDRQKAERLLRLCAESGDGWAMWKLATIYDPASNGPESNHALCMQWLKRGAATGRVEAMTSLAAKYLELNGSLADVAELLDTALPKLDWFRTWEGGEIAIEGFEEVLCWAARKDGFSAYLTPGLIDYAKKNRLREVLACAQPQKKGIFSRLFGG